MKKKAQKGIVPAKIGVDGRPLGRPAGPWMGPEYNELRKWFGTNVKKLRERRGLSQTAMGQMMKPNDAKSAIIRIEQGGSSPLLCRATQFAKVLGTTLDALQQHPDKLNLDKWDQLNQMGEADAEQMIRLLELMHVEEVRKDLLELLQNATLREKLLATAKTIWND